MATFAEIKCGWESRPIIRCVCCMELRPFHYEREGTKTKYCLECVTRIVSKGNGAIAHNSIELKSPDTKTDKDELSRLRRQLFRIVNKPEMLRQENFVDLTAKKMGENKTWVNTQLNYMRKKGMVIPTRVERCRNFKVWLLQQREQSFLPNAEFAEQIAEETGYTKRYILDLVRDKKSNTSPPPLKPVCDAVIDILRFQRRSPYGSIEKSLCKFPESAVRYAVQILVEMKKINKKKLGGRVILSIVEE